MGETSGLAIASIDAAGGLFPANHCRTAVISCHREGVFMRKSYLLLAGAGAVVLAACSGAKKGAMNDDLKNDLALASSSDGITLANSSPNAGQQVISAIERTAPPTRQAAPYARLTH